MIYSRLKNTRLKNVKTLLSKEVSNLWFSLREKINGKKTVVSVTVSMENCNMWKMQSPYSVPFSVRYYSKNYK